MQADVAGSEGILESDELAGNAAGSGNIRPRMARSGPWSVRRTA